jgi:hypothetical protein
MIDASERLVTASCPRCDLLFSVDARPTLTDAEREAVEAAIIGGCEMADTLRNLLERLK